MLNNEFKNKLKDRFEKLSVFNGKRLLAIHLDGFSHSIIYDSGSQTSVVEHKEYSSYIGSLDMGYEESRSIASIFIDVPNYQYQGNPVEIVYVMPKER